ncbi:MAG: hypothetical protein K2X29_04735 [Candidatus Obscuribacterales bacterium]|nr:hypothetical protein [Candidatus Obscuribacterales bacterium]
MPDVVISDLSPEIIEMLEEKAKLNNHSLQSYLKMVVVNAANSSDVNREELMARHVDMIGVKTGKDGIMRRPDGSVFDYNLRPDGTPWTRLDRLGQSK